MSKSSVVKIQNVSVRYLDTRSLFGSIRYALKKPTSNVRKWALRNINLNLTDGDSVALIGRNGSGKTTLLKTIGGIYEPSKGLVAVNGSLASLYDLSLGFLPDDTGRENIIRKLLLMGYSRSRINALVDEVISFSELYDYIDRPLTSYSSGMRMRLAFATVTSVKPNILLMDEWISTGDKAFVEKIKDRLDDFIDKSDVLVLASHSEKLLKEVCEKGLVIHEGEQKYYGSIDDAIEFYNVNILGKSKQSSATDPENNLFKARFWINKAFAMKDISPEQYVTFLSKSIYFINSEISSKINDNSMEYDHLNKSYYWLGKAIELRLVGGKDYDHALTKSLTLINRVMTNE